MGGWNAAKPGPMRSSSTRQSDHLAKQCGLMYVCTAFSQSHRRWFLGAPRPFLLFSLCVRGVLFFRLLLRLVKHRQWLPFLFSKATATWRLETRTRAHH